MADSNISRVFIMSSLWRFIRLLRRPDALRINAY